MAQEDYGTDLLVYSCRRNTSAGRFAGTGWLVGSQRLCCLFHCKQPTNRGGVYAYMSRIQVPIAVAAYVLQGGLRSTFVADYLHTVILFVAIFIFAFTLYTADDYAGSTGRVYDLLVEAGNKTPLAGNRHGSWLTFQSSTGIKYAAVIFLGSFSTVWLDQAYWQRAIASKPETSVKAYLLGGVSTERPSAPSRPSSDRFVPESLIC